MKEKFEAWYLENWGCTEDHLDSLFEESPHGNEYYRFGVRLAWQAWQAATKQSEAKCAALAAENAGLIEQSEEVYAAGYNHGHLNTVDGIAYADCVEDDFYGLAVELMREAETPSADAFLAEVRAQGLNTFIQHHSAELDAHIKNGGEQFDEKSVRIRDIIVSARLFMEQIRQEAAQ